MSKINLAEKLEFASQIHRLLFETNDTQRLQKRLLHEYSFYNFEIEILIISVSMLLLYEQKVMNLSLLSGGMKKKRG